MPTMTVANDEARGGEGFGDLPTDRRNGGVVASTPHGNCTGCWYPNPLTALVDDKCPDCRGVIPDYTDHSPPSREDYL